MKHARHAFFPILCLLALSGAADCARADEYADVSQLLRAGKYAQALAKAEQHLSTKPKDAQMRFLKGAIESDSGKTTEALATYTGLSVEYPELPEPYNNMAVLFAGQGEYGKARAALEMAVRLNPGYATAHENLGDIYAKLADQAYTKSLQLEPGGKGLTQKLVLVRQIFPAPAPGARTAPALAAPKPAASAAVAAPAPGPAAAASGSR